MTRLKQSDLLPIDWPGVELQYRAGIKPLRLIGTQFGCSHTAIKRRATHDGWLRGLKPRIHALADDLVSNAAVSTQVSKADKISEDETVQAGASHEVAVRLGPAQGHRAGPSPSGGC